MCTNMKHSGTDMWITPYNDDDIKVALQAATQMAQRWGEDMAIMPDLKAVALRYADEPPLEIVRCPAAFKKETNEG